MAALGGVQVLPVEDGSPFTCVREGFYRAPLPIYTWGQGSIPWHEYLYGGAPEVPTTGQTWPR